MPVKNMHFSFKYFLKIILLARYHQHCQVILAATGMNGLRRYLSKRCTVHFQLLMFRGPHRYTRTVRVPILRPKIPVKKCIISNQYFGTGTMTEKSAETRDRRENTSQIRDRVIRLSRSIYLGSRDRGWYMGPHSELHFRNKESNRYRYR